jgi:hypothetical protein
VSSIIVPVADRKSAQVHLLLSPRELEQLEQLRARLHMNRSEVLRAALALFIEQEGCAA